MTHDLASTPHVSPEKEFGSKTPRLQSKRLEVKCHNPPSDIHGDGTTGQGVCLSHLSNAIYDDTTKVRSKTLKSSSDIENDLIVYPSSSRPRLPTLGDIKELNRFLAIKILFNVGGGWLLSAEKRVSFLWRVGCLCFK